MFGSNKIEQYVSACGRQFYISKLPTGIIVSIEYDVDRVVGIFVLPWYFPEDLLKWFIEEWDIVCYKEINWDKVRFDLESDEEDLEEEDY